MPGPRLEFEVNTTEIARGSKQLDTITDSARKAAKAERDLSKATQEFSAAAGKANKETAKSTAGTKDQAAEVAKLRKELADLQKQMKAGGTEHKRAKKATEEMTETNRLAAWQLKQLGFQMNDVFTSLGSGAPFMQVMAQQGGQIYQALSGGKLSVGAALKDIGGRMAGLVTPARLAMGSIAGVGIAATAAFFTAEARVNRFKQALNGVGAGSGLSSSQLQAIAFNSGNGLGYSAAEAAAGSFAGAGLRPGLVRSLTGSVRRFSDSYGGSEDDNIKTLTDAFRDPVKGMETLNQRMGFLNAATEMRIRILDRQGRIDEARNVLQRAYTEALQKATPAVGVFTQAMRAASRFGSGIWRGAEGAIGMLTNGKTDQQRLNDMRARRDSMLDRYNASPRFFGPALSTIEKLNKEIITLQQKIATADQKRLDEAEAQRRQEKSRKVFSAIGEVAPEGEAIRVARDRLKLIQDAIADPKMIRELGDAAKELPGALERAKGALENALITPLQRLRQDGDAAVATVTARTLAERADAAARVASLNVMRQTSSQLQANQAAENARNLVLANATREINQMVRDSRNALASAGMRPYQRGLEQIRQRYQDARERLGGGGAGSAGPIAAAATRLASGFNSVFAAKLGQLQAQFPMLRMTSGVRSHTEQARLKALYGSGAAAPGTSRHEVGLAADFSGKNLSSQQRMAVIAAARSLGLEVIPSNHGALHVQGSRSWGGRSAVPAGTGARPLTVGRGGLALAQSNEEAAFRKDQSSTFTRGLSDQIMEQERALRLQIQTLGKSNAEIATQEFRQKALNDAYREGGIELQTRMTPAIDKLTERYSAVARGQEQFNEAVKGFNSVRDAADGFGSSLRSAFLSGKRGTELLKAGLQSLGAKFLELAQNKLMEFLFGQSGKPGGLFGGGLMSLFSAVKFADGGVMTDRGPVPLRRYAKGGVANTPQVSVWGEGRTPEAMVPLQDGRNIPVRMLTPPAGPRRVTQTFAPVMGGHTINIQGSASDQSVAALRAELASRDAELLQTIKRDFGDIARNSYSLYGQD